jgi:beta-N-acetylhexosaminidase
MGFNLDFAPVADVLTNPENTVVKNRSYGNDAKLVSSMVKQELTGLESHGVYGCIKHFPGHGATVGDTHEGYAYTDKTWDELKTSEVIPFADCITQGVSFLMVGHISLPNVTGDNTPASLSETMITTYLQGELGYQGIVLTDALNMKAVTEQYTSAEAAVKAVNAGVDMLLMPADFSSAYSGVLSAVQNGTITQERLDTSVQKILKVKMTLK